MISGSAVSNVMVDGWLTIPLMQKVGFRAQLAAAIEAVASTGGQLMPPIMGAAAFIIPDMIGKTYLDVILAAAIPGILYYMALFFMVDFEAANLGLKGLSEEELPSFKKTMKEGYPFIIPIAVLIYSIGIIGTSPTIAGFWATVSVLGATLLRKSTRMDLKKIIKALETAAYGAVVVVSACALGGILIGIVMMTGLGMNLSTIIVDLSGGNTLFLLLLTMITSLILGMGMTTTACYIILAILVGPALIKMGISPMGAHLFIFYFGIISCITPPVALAAYAAAGLGNTDPMKTGYTAFRIGVTGFIIPFMFIYRPELILEGSFLMIITSFLTTSLGVYALCAAAQGYLLGELILVKRVILFIAALLLIVPGFITDAIGFFLVLIIFLSQMYQRSKRRNQPYQAPGT
jgi:TRAP transporter 4TM/12TM fusion protein